MGQIILLLGTAMAWRWWSPVIRRSFADGGGAARDNLSVIFASIGGRIDGYF
jgi:hypothetical protein